MTSKLRAVQEEARELIRDSIVEDAISRFIAQILEVAAKDRADRLAATLARADALEAALKRTEANRDAAMEDAAEEYARAERAEAELAKARELIAMLEGEQERADNLSDKLEIDRALTDGAHRRAKVAEVLLAEAVEALRFYAPTEADGIRFSGGDDAGQRARATLARIQGDSHE